MLALRVNAELRCTASVAAARQRGNAIVALESSVFAQGLAPPFNRAAFTGMRDAVVGAGATPAVLAVDRGVPVAGLDDATLERFLKGEAVRKVSARDLALAIVDGADGATTVAGALALCALARLEVFATGGIGGVHRDAPFDESADLYELSRTSAVVVCAGAKSILDVAATLERLETLGVPVIGYRTREFPGFFTTGTGLRLSATANSADQLAAAWRAHLSLGRPGAMLVVQPLPEHLALDPHLVEEATAIALREASAQGVRGAAVTPFLLEQVRQRTHGASVQANLALLEQNATLAAEVAVQLIHSDLR